MAQPQARINAYLDFVLPLGFTVENMEQEIRSRVANMAPDLAAQWTKMLDTNPPRSMMGWGAYVLEARENMRDYPRT